MDHLRWCNDDFAEEIVILFSTLWYKNGYPTIRKSVHDMVIEKFFDFHHFWRKLDWKYPNDTYSKL